MTTSVAQATEWLSEIFSDHDQFAAAEPELRALADDCPLAFSRRIKANQFMHSFLEDPTYPLHHACFFPSVSLETVRSVHRAFPAAISRKVSRYEQILPIHMAVHCCCSADVVEYLAQQWPKGVTMADRTGLTPLHHACENSSYRRAGRQAEVLSVLLRANSNVAMKQLDFDQSTPLHLLCQNDSETGVSLASFRVLLNAAPHAASVRNDDDNLPLFYAIDNGSLIQPDALQLLLEAYPEAVDSDCLGRAWEKMLSWDIRGLLMEYYAKGTLELSDEYTRLYPLHVALLCPHPCEEAFDACIHQFESCICSLDESGYLPLHIASRSDMVFPSTIAKLAELEPRAVFVRDPNSGWYPFLAVAIRYNGEDEEDYDCSPWGMHMQMDGDNEFLDGVRKSRRAQQLDLVYRLLRMNPARACAVTP